MKSAVVYSQLAALRDQPLWRLLAAKKAPVVLAVLATLFPDGAPPIAASVLVDRVAAELELLRSEGEGLPQTPQQYIEGWRQDGWLSRALPVGATEEQYELTTDAAAAIRYVLGLIAPRSRVTESRLATVIDRLIRLSEETDPDARARLQYLRAERERIDRAEAAIKIGDVQVLPDDRAIERLHEVVNLAQGLTDDFRRLRADFNTVNTSLRSRLLDMEGNRGDVLARLFADVDVIAESEPGQSFAAFWRLLTDPALSGQLEDALEQTMKRPFSKALGRTDRQFLLRLTRTLLQEGDAVHAVMRTLARNLKQFVQSREYLENRRLQQLVSEAQRQALALKDGIRLTRPLDRDVFLTSSPIDSIGRRQLHDPALRADLARGMMDGEAADIRLNDIAELIAASEIDFRELRENIARELVGRHQVDVPTLLAIGGAPQGFGTVVGYVSLAIDMGEVLDDERHDVAWIGRDGVRRAGTIPAVYFLRGCVK